MFRDLVVSALGAGLAACLAITALQSVTTEPLILHAEIFETVGEVTAQEAWEPADGVERTLYTALANLLMGIAVSAILLALMVLKGDPIDVTRGLLWGAAGFVAASLLPSLGLPPELPGTATADLLSRQAWWLGTVVASAIGLFAMAFGRHWGWRAAGLALLVAPHLVGVPQPSSEAHEAAGLAGEFFVASLLVSAVLWSLSGLASGWLYQRLSQAR